MRAWRRASQDFSFLRVKNRTTRNKLAVITEFGGRVVKWIPRVSQSQSGFTRPAHRWVKMISWLLQFLHLMGQLTFGIKSFYNCLLFSEVVSSSVEESSHRWLLSAHKRMLLTLLKLEARSVYRYRRCERNSDTGDRFTISKTREINWIHVQAPSKLISCFTLQWKSFTHTLQLLPLLPHSINNTHRQ